jgi:uncharacterized protein
MRTLMILLFFLILSAFLGYHFRMSLLAYYLKLPSPQYSVRTEKNIMIKADDGTLLANDIYRPKDNGKFPVILARTPYGKSSYRHLYPIIAELFASQGYIFIMQDVRGKFHSEGDFIPYLYEADDGHASVEWAGQLPYSNGKVALTGFSYLGSCAWLAAVRPSPYLATIVPLFSCRDTYRGWYEDGIPYLKDMLFWSARYEGRYDASIEDNQVKAILHTLPQDQLDHALTGKSLSIFQDFISHPQPGAFWEERGSKDQSFPPDLPILIFDGWYDRMSHQSLTDFQDLSKSQSAPVRLIMGPWYHDPMQQGTEMPIPRNAPFSDQLNTMLQWFEQTLKGIGTPSAGVTYYQTGSNIWQHSPVWPPKSTREQHLFLGNQKLLPNPNSQGEALTFSYDPEHPVPSIGTHMIYAWEHTGPADQTVLSQREDVLTFTTEVLEESLAVAGPVALELYFETSAPSTDVVAKLADVQPDGTSRYLQSGAVRLSNHNSQKLLKISLHSIAHTFLKGHRIQLLITSSDFPNRSRNLNTDDIPEQEIRAQKALQTVYTGQETPSRLILLEKSVTADPYGNEEEPARNWNGKG